MGGDMTSTLYPGVIGILFSVGCFGIILVCCALSCTFYHCFLDREEIVFNSTTGGFGERRRRVAYRDTVTAPAAIFTKYWNRSQPSIDLDQQEEETNLKNNAIDMV